MRYLVLCLLLTGCSTSSGFLTGGTTATGWAKCYTTDGMASIGGGTMSAQGQLVGEMDSAGLVWNNSDGTATESVLLEVAKKCPSVPAADPPP